MSVALYRHLCLALASVTARCCCVGNAVLVNICGQEFPKRKERFAVPKRVFSLPYMTLIGNCYPSKSQFFFSFFLHFQFFSAFVGFPFCIVWYFLVFLVFFGCNYCEFSLFPAIPGRRGALNWTKAWLPLARSSAGRGWAAKIHKQTKRSPVPKTHADLSTLAITASCPGWKANIAPAH